jgi:hypothetical protein
VNDNVKEEEGLEEEEENVPEERRTKYSVTSQKKTRWEYFKQRLLDYLIGKLIKYLCVDLKTKKKT